MAASRWSPRRRRHRAGQVGIGPRGDAQLVDDAAEHFETVAGRLVRNPGRGRPTFPAARSAAPVRSGAASCRRPIRSPPTPANRGPPGPAPTCSSSFSISCWRPDEGRFGKCGAAVAGADHAGRLEAASVDAVGDVRQVQQRRLGGLVAVAGILAQQPLDRLRPGPEGWPVRRLRSSSGRAVMCCRRIAPTLSPSKGGRPARHSKSTTPAEYRSAVSPTSKSREPVCSGDRYRAVSKDSIVDGHVGLRDPRQIAVHQDRRRPVAFLRRRMMLRRADVAVQDAAAVHFLEGRQAGSGPRSARRPGPAGRGGGGLAGYHPARRGEPGTGSLPARPKSSKGLTQGPASWRNTEASCSNRIRAPEETSRAGTSLTITSRPVWESVARSTVPSPLWPAVAARDNARRIAGESRFRRREWIV